MTPERIARERISQNLEAIRFAIKSAKRGNPFAAERDIERLTQRAQKKWNLEPKQAEAVCAQVSNAEKIHQPLNFLSTMKLTGMPSDVREAMHRVPSIDDQEKIWGDTIDFVNVAFLEKGAYVAKSVGRVAYRDGSAQGSGVMIGDGLFLTNHHVIPTKNVADRLVVEFDFERDLYGHARSVSRFEFDASVFVTDPVDGLDFTIIGVGRRIHGDAELASFGVTGLSDADDKHMIGEFANIVQHPNGRFKEVVLRENRLVGRFDDSLHYVADTEPGSSGSPVYNSQWQLIALHHWGGPWIDGPVDTDGSGASFDINEGIRVSSIVRQLKRRRHRLPTHMSGRIFEALEQGEKGWRYTETINSKSDPSGGSEAASGPSAKIEDDGRVTWTIPLEVSVRLPSASMPNADPAQPNVSDPSSGPNLQSDGSEAKTTIEDYADREGYDPQFLPGFRVPLPSLSDENMEAVAELLDEVPGDSRIELKYHHFSVVMNGDRRLAFFTACNIDGKTAKSIKRAKDRDGNRKVSTLEPTNSGLAELLGDMESAESESWMFDPRIPRASQVGKSMYDSQKVPGFPRGRDPNRIKRMFQKGHLVRRIDPAWGDRDRAIEAEIDTFHWTNAAPQVGFFNQGKADKNQKGTGGGKLWRAAENYVLRNAVSDGRQRVTSFTGPIFSKNDRDYRTIKIPGAFFKIAVWVEEGELKSIALLVDQEQVFKEWPEALGTLEFDHNVTAAEAFLDDDELSRVSDFLTTIEAVEAATGIDFGEDVRNGDVRAGLAPEVLTSSSQLSGKQAVSAPGDDDLTRISGVGPQMAKRMNDAGITTFAEIAGWSAAKAEEMDEKLRARGSVTRRDWVGQAKVFLSE